MTSHPNDSVFRSLIAGKLDRDSERALERHLHECPVCRARLDALEKNNVDSLFEKIRAAQNLESSFGDVQSGQIFGSQYRLESRLGRGGMGVAWKAHDETAGREVVLKFVSDTVFHPGEAMAAVRDSFQKVWRLQHRHICPLYSLSDDPELGLYIVMKYIDGLSLDQCVRQNKNQNKKLSFSAILRILYDVADALDYAHSQRVIHRDIKPQNIMIGKIDGVQIIDFGLAAEIRETSMASVTQSPEKISGTRPYMAPEQWEGARQDARTDQYALAVTAYELIAGHVPFSGTDTEVLRHAVLHCVPKPIPNMPETVNAALRRGLAKRRTDRFENCRAFVKALAQKSPHPSPLDSTVPVPAAVPVPIPTTGPRRFPVPTPPETIPPKTTPTVSTDSDTPDDDVLPNLWIDHEPSAWPRRATLFKWVILPLFVLALIIFLLRASCRFADENRPDPNTAEPAPTSPQPTPAPTSLPPQPPQPPHTPNIPTGGRLPSYDDIRGGNLALASEQMPYDPGFMRGYQSVSGRYFPDDLVQNSHGMYALDQLGSNGEKKKPTVIFPTRNYTAPSIRVTVLVSDKGFGWLLIKRGSTIEPYPGFYGTLFASSTFQDAITFRGDTPGVGRILFPSGNIMVQPRTTNLFQQESPPWWDLWVSGIENSPACKTTVFQGPINDNRGVGFRIGRECRLPFALTFEIIDNAPTPLPNMKIELRHGTESCATLTLWGEKITYGANKIITISATLTDSFQAEDRKPILSQQQIKPNDALIQTFELPAASVEQVDHVTLSLLARPKNEDSQTGMFELAFLDFVGRFKGEPGIEIIDGNGPAILGHNYFAPTEGGTNRVVLSVNDIGGSYQTIAKQLETLHFGDPVIIRYRSPEDASNGNASNILSLTAE